MGSFLHIYGVSLYKHPLIAYATANTCVASAGWSLIFSYGEQQS